MELSEIVRLVELDQVLTANLLRVANSAWSGSLRQIMTVRDALLRLGVGRILEFAVGCEVAKPMAQELPGYGLAEKELWRHSVAAALAVEYMSAVTSKPIPPAAFTAALLHDIGKLLLNKHLGPEGQAAMAELTFGEGLPYVEAERRLLGTDHAEVGGVLARLWDLPEPLVTAIEMHHDAHSEPNDLLDAVQVGNAVAKLIGVGFGNEQLNLRVNSESLPRLGISAKGLELLCLRVVEGLVAAENFFEGKDDGTKRADSR
jgi:uncharacterized domain HDIG